MGRTGRWLAITIGASIACAGFVACEATVDPPIEVVGTAKPPPGGSPGDSGTDAAVDSAAPGCFGADAGGCNDLALCGAKILITNVALAPPAPTGGAIAPGVYSMTSYTAYTGTGGVTGTPGNWFKETFQVLPAPSGDAGVDAGASHDAAIDAAVSVDAAIDAGLEDAGPVTTTYPWLDITQSDQSGPPTNLSGVLVTTGTSLDYEFDCPPGAQSAFASYSATATTLTIFLVEQGNLGTGALVYTLMQ
jgi:hypothetical protein